VSVQAQEELAAVLTEVQPQAVITHWHESVHRDHTASYYNTLAALALAKLGTVPIFFAENWEDNLGTFRAEVFVEVEKEDVDAWENACKAFQFFRESFYDFPYRQYYQSLFFSRGAEARMPLAKALMRHPTTRRSGGSELPDVPL